jgi:hypothetical protein
MVGFRSIQHQGWAGAKAAEARGDNAPYMRDPHNPYPYGDKGGCGAFYEYQDGCNAYRRGDIIDCRGNVASRARQTPPREY